MKNDFKRLWNSLPSPFRDQFYCDENIRTFNYTMYSGYCLKYCLGVYTPNFSGPLQFFSVNYKNCDEEACCIHLVEYCINRTNGEVVKYSESTTQTGANCESIQNPPSCYFLQIPNYTLNTHYGTCTNTCTQE